MMSMVKVNNIINYQATCVYIRSVSMCMQVRLNGEVDAKFSVPAEERVESRGK